MSVKAITLQQRFFPDGENFIVTLATQAEHCSSHIPNGITDIQYTYIFIPSNSSWCPCWL